MIPQPPLLVTDSFPQGSLGPYGAAGGHIGPPLRGHRSAQQRQAGRDRARPLRIDRKSCVPPDIPCTSGCSTGHQWGVGDATLYGEDPAPNRIKTSPY